MQEQEKNYKKEGTANEEPQVFAVFHFTKALSNPRSNHAAQVVAQISFKG